MTSIKNVPCMAATIAENNSINKFQDNCKPRSKKSQGKLSHLLEAVKIAKSSYRALERGAEVQMKTERKIPCYTLGCNFMDTVEGCTIWNHAKGTFDIVKRIFAAQPEEIKHRLCFSQKNGEFISRAHVWQELLKPALPAAQYYEVMGAIYQWYRHIKQTRKENTYVNL